jgi:hypothetical protein
MSDHSVKGANMKTLISGFIFAFILGLMLMWITPDKGMVFKLWLFLTAFTTLMYHGVIHWQHWCVRKANKDLTSKPNP